MTTSSSAPAHGTPPAAGGGAGAARGAPVSRGRSWLSALLWLLLFVGVLAMFNWGLYGGVSTVSLNRATEILGEPGDSILQEDFDTQDAFEGWDRQSGRWELRNGNATQIDTDEYDTRALHEAPMAPILIQSSFRLLEGAAAGLIFDSVEGGSTNMQMVRFTEDGNFLLWGWIDGIGVFHQDGAALVPPAGVEWQTLEILREEERYAIILNDRLIAEGQPRRLRGRLAGMTTSRSSAEFDWFRLRSIERKPDGTPSALADSAREAGPVGAASASVAGSMLNPLLQGGQWQQQESTLIQSDARPRLFALPTTMLGTTFSATVEIDFPASGSQSAAGGLLLSLLRPGAPIEDHLVLLGNDGQTLQWGVVDENGAFVVEGEGSLEGASGGARSISVAASQRQVWILIDGEELTKVAWDTTYGGWVGLASQSGPVRFDGFRMGLGRLLE